MFTRAGLGVLTEPRRVERLYGKVFTNRANFRSGGHPGCRRGRASRRPDRPVKLRRRLWTLVVQEGMETTDGHR